jgi:hypothetical protein
VVVVALVRAATRTRITGIRRNLRPGWTALSDCGRK